MEDLQRRKKTEGSSRGMIGYNPAKLSTRRPDQATLGRSGSSGLSQSTAAKRRLNQQSMDDEDSIRSTGQVRSASGSSRAGGAGSSREGRLAGGATATSAKGKEREHARLETSSPARRRRERDEDDDGRATQGVTKKTLARSSALKELSDDSDDDFPTHVQGALKRSPSRKPVTATTKFNRTTSPQKGRKRPSRSDEDDDDDGSPKSTLASTLSLARPPTPDPPLPNFKKKSDKSVPQRTLSNIPSPVVPERQPVEPVLSKPRPAIASSSSSALVYDLDSPKRSIVKRNSDPPSSPPVDRSAKARSRASSATSSLSRRERDQVEDDLTPKKKSSRPKSKVKLQPVQSDAAPLGVTNPFGVAETQPTSPSASERTPSTSAKALHPVKATPAPFPWEASTSSTSSTSKPSGLKARGSNQLPKSEGDEETRTVGVQFRAKATKEVKLTPAELEARRRATKEAVSQETDDSSSEGETAQPKKKKITILSCLTPFQQMSEHLREKAKHEKLYGKEDGAHETGQSGGSSRAGLVPASVTLTRYVNVLRFEFRPTAPRPASALCVLFGAPACPPIGQTAGADRSAETARTCSADDVQQVRGLALDVPVDQRLHPPSVRDVAPAERAQERMADRDRLGGRSETGAQTSNAQRARQDRPRQGKQRLLWVRERAG